MQLPTYFEDFLQNIRPTDDEVDDYIEGHTSLRKALLADAALSPHIVGTFLQGSYRRHTAIKAENGQKSDVDLVIVTDFDAANHSAKAVVRAFTDFLDRQDDYKDRYELNAHSIAIALDVVKLDLVVTSAPSEAGEQAVKALSQATSEALVKRSIDGADEWLRRVAKSNDWKLEPLRIPDSDNNDWEWTHPLEQIRWTSDHNRACNSHYVNVVKALKWWRRTNFTLPKRPKGYPVEHLIGTFCPAGITSVAEGVTLTLEGIVNDPALNLDVALTRTPVLPDRGIPANNVFDRVDGVDFAQFFQQVRAAAKIARTALDATDAYESSRCWHELFGDEFPEAEPPDDGDDDGGSKSRHVTTSFPPSIRRGSRSDVTEAPPFA